MAAIAALALLPTVAWGGNIFDNLTYYARLGYNLGGTAPVGMPATIRSLDKFTPKANGTIALDAYKPLNGRWGLIAGFHVESKGMKTDAKVKNYHMEIRQGGETLDGMFTGNVVTDVDMWMVTLPLQATYTTGKVRLKAGPFLSYLLSSNFSGYAYDGHLRVGNPTGTRVDLGTDEASRGTYDFSDDLRRVHFGVDVGADWQFLTTLRCLCRPVMGLDRCFQERFQDHRADHVPHLRKHRNNIQV